jgi:hypothetical protein
MIKIPKGVWTVFPLHLDGCTSTARNFHNKALSVRTLKVVVRTVELGMHDLPYRGHRPDRITHHSDGCSRLPITMS